MISQKLAKNVGRSKGKRATRVRYATAEYMVCLIIAWPQPVHVTELGHDGGWNEARKGGGGVTWRENSARYQTSDMRHGGSSTLSSAGLRLLVARFHNKPSISSGIQPVAN